MRPPPHPCSPYGRTNTQTGGAGTFYFSNAEPYDWTTPQNNALWQDAAKTLFDPCPPGWRVPRSGEGDRSPWQNFATDNGPWQETETGNGRLFDLSVVVSGPAWYPASGGRSWTIGVLWSIGSYGFDWSSSKNTHYGYGLWLLTSEVRPANDHYCAMAFPVRCIRE